MERKGDSRLFPPSYSKHPKNGESKSTTFFRSKNSDILLDYEMDLKEYLVKLLGFLDIEGKVLESLRGLYKVLRKAEHYLLE